MKEMKNVVNMTRNTVLFFLIGCFLKSFRGKLEQ